MPKRFVVAPLADFPPGQRLITRIEGREIGVFRVGDRFYAIRNRCPHQGGPLCQGRVHQRIVCDGPGEVRTVSGTPFIACPWHAWEYDLETGQSFLGSGEPGVASYSVVVEAGEELESVPQPALVKGPYVAETFPVHVEEEYVVVEI